MCWPALPGQSHFPRMGTSAGESASNHEKDHRRKQKLDADDLVIFGEDIPADEGNLMVLVGGGFMRSADAHARSSPINGPWQSLLGKIGPALLLLGGTQPF